MSSKSNVSMRLDDDTIVKLKLKSKSLGLTQAGFIKFLVDNYENENPTWFNLETQMPPLNETVLLSVTYGDNDKNVLMGYLELYEVTNSFLFRDLEYNDVTTIVNSWTYIPTGW